MRNNLQAAWRKSDDPGEWAGLHDRSRGRLTILFAAFATVLSAIAIRMAYIQCVLPDGLIAVFDETVESFEEIPARDGRIFAADGVSLAESEERFDLAVHYRWIEEPANSEWLRRRALRLLNRRERRDTAKIATAEADVLTRRDELWNSLAELTHVSRDAIRIERERIQSRVERIWERVNSRRTETAEEIPAVDEVQATASKPWTRFWQELTTPPPRAGNDPLIIAEQDQDHVVWEGVAMEIAAEVESHPERYPGVRVIPRRRRIYPEGDLAAHLIGARTAIEPDEASESFAGASSLGDSRGRSGLERSYDALLCGKRGLRRIVRNRRQEIVQTQIVREPRSGRDLVLTFDAGLQRRAEQLLDRVLAAPPPSDTGVAEESNGGPSENAGGPRGACLVALDVRNGAILAAASAPRFDANLLIQADDRRWQEVLDDPRRPLFPRVTQMALPPGSTFKTLSAMALVEDGGLDPQARFLCQGYLDRPDKDRCLVFRHYGIGHNETNLADALCRSCNVYFFTAARAAGPEPLIAWSRKLGIGQPTGIDIPGEASGRLPSPGDRGDATRRRWYPGDTLGLVIGQSSLLVTPLQMARLMAAVANGGDLVTPHLASGAGNVFHDLSLDALRTDVSAADAADENVPLFKSHPPRRIAGLHAETLAVIRDGLERVVNDRRGTGYKTVRLPDVRIAGKTGTAEVGGRLPDHAWFAGYVPADEPRVAFVVVIEHGGSGGKVAGPIAREFVTALLEQGVIAGEKTLARE